MRRTYAVAGIVASFMVAASLAWSGETVDLREGWRFAPDPDRIGLSQGWEKPGFDDASWTMISAGQRWEDQGFEKVDGAAWYRKRISPPESMKSAHLWLVLGGLNDSGTVYCNGERVGTFGDENGKLSVARTPVAVDLGKSIRWGGENVLAVQVVDWGGSGGLAVEPCVLTTDTASVPMRSLFQFMPGFEGQHSLTGLPLASLGLGNDVKVRFAAAVNDAAPQEREAAIQTDRAGQAFAVAEFDLRAKPGDRVRLTATATAGDSAPFVLERTYACPAAPEWSEKYKHLRVLNNFVTELAAEESLPEGSTRYAFLNPREGWVFVRVHGSEGAVARLDDEAQPLVWRKAPETGDLEAMRLLTEGEHVLTVESAKGARLDVRAVPELAFCYWPTRAVLKALPPRDRAFAERFIFPVSNTLLTHNDMSEEEFASWRAEGRQWLNNSSLPGLHEKEAPTVESVYEEWAANPVVTRPGYAGLIVDEFIDDPPAYYAAWTGAIEQLYANPGFKDKTFYAWVVETHRSDHGLSLMRRLYELGGRFAWERYLREEPTEELAMLKLYEELGALEDWSAKMPGVKERLLYCLGSFTTPSCSLNLNPGTNYLPYMDRQFQVLATDPLFFGSRGLFQWAAHYADDDALRYAQSLVRHYCIEGNRTPFRDYSYELNHVVNPDFTQGLSGWDVEAAAAGSVAAQEYANLGRIQGRWGEGGDQCAVMVRSDKAPNRIQQTIRNLEPGHLYSMKFIAADLDHLNAEQEVGLWADLQGVDLVAERSFRYVMPSSFALDLKEANRDNPAYTTYVQVMFRPKEVTAKLTFSDWKDGQPSGTIGQRIAFNFVEIMPYFDK